MRLSRCWAIARKEFFHIYRDPRSLALVILMPALLMLLFGYAVTLDVKRVSIVVLDRDHTQESLSFIQRFSASPYFNLRFVARDEKEVKQLIDQGDVKMGLIIPWNFSRTVKSGRKAAVQVLLDGSDSNTANIVLSYVQAIGRQYTQEQTFIKVERMGLQKANLPVEGRTRVWFNEELESKNYFIPGLIAVIMSIIGVLLTGQVIVREWERGTMELLISTPVRKGELIIGKLFPYFFLSLLDLTLAAFDGEMALSGSPERERYAAFSSLLSLYSRGPGAGHDHFRGSQDPALSQSDGDDHRISAHLPPFRVYLLDFQYARLAPGDDLCDCAKVLCDDS